MSKQSESASAIAAAVVGAIFGAAAVVFSDKKRRRKFVSSVTELLNEGEDRFESTKNKVQEAVEVGRKKISTQLDKAEEKIRKETEGIKRKKKS